VTNKKDVSTFEKERSWQQMEQLRCMYSSEDTIFYEVVDYLWLIPCYMFSKPARVSNTE
jgi:hypothetical protein